MECTNEETNILIDGFNEVVERLDDQQSNVSSIIGSFTNLGRPSDMNEEKVICDRVIQEQQLAILIGGRNQVSRIA